MEQNGHTYEPVRTELPEQCYSILPGSGEIIVVKRNEKGYYNPHIPAASKEQAREIVDEYNGKLGVTRAQEEAMRTGSMFGFHVPGADPKTMTRTASPCPRRTEVTPDERVLCLLRSRDTGGQNDLPYL